jgi:hypothetical protein
MICEELVELPHSSVAVHVLVKIKFPAQDPEVVEVVKTTPNGMELQLSVAVTVAGGGIVEQFEFVFAGTPDSTGPVMSVTVIICDSVVELPQAFVAVQVLVIM